MPSLCNERRCPQNISRRRKVPRTATRPTVQIGQHLDGADDNTTDSDDNISPDAEKSESRFTLERRQGGGGKGNGNGNGNNNPKKEDDKSSSSDGSDSGGGGGNNNNNNNNGFNKGGSDGNKDKGNGGDGNDNGSSGRGGNGNRGGSNNGDNGDGGKKSGDNGDKGGKGQGDDRGSSTSSSDDNSSTSLPPTSSSSLPPPPPSTTAVEASTTTSIVVSTSIVIPEPTTTLPSPILAPPTQVTQLPAVSEPPSAVSSATAIADMATTEVSISTLPTAGLGESSTPVPSQTSSPNGAGNGRGGRHGNNNNNNNGANSNKADEKGINTTSELILVSAGSVGAFIVLCFVGWIVYRTLKKSKQPGREDNHRNWLSALIPWRRRSATNSARASDASYGPKDLLPTYDVGNKNSMEAVGYYDQGKLYPQESDGAAYPSATTLQAEGAMWQTLDGQTLTLVNPPNQYGQPNGQIMDGGDVNSTLQSRMPDSYYNQPKLARQPSSAYNPGRRQTYRASEISSLSSGFGDGDIIMPPPNIVARPPVPPVPNTDTGNPSFPWTSRTGTEQRRDTMYTMASDRPPQFRSINSWVDQQKERIERARSLLMVLAQFIAALWGGEDASNARKMLKR
ncbi:hypothetical protein GGR51DRAFT_572845 [Nemania sp. FL0031]|nr:hypothetical protein GGR51DRAFT_572845 [Nemania sp. FL0031]